MDDIVSYFHSIVCRAVLIFLVVVAIVGMSANVVSGCPCPSPGTFLNCDGECSSENDCRQCHGKAEGCECAG